MNELETNLDVIIRSVVDEPSAKKAPQEIARTVLSALKNGCFEIPTALSDKIDDKKFSRKLVNAQQAFIDQWKKMINEGFSSSEEDLVEFMKTFRRFKSLLGKEAPDSRADKALKNIGLTNMEKIYSSTQKKLKKVIKEAASTIDVGQNVKTQVKKGKQRRISAKTNAVTDDREAIEDAIEKRRLRLMSEKRAKEVGLSNILRSLGDERTTDLRYGKSRRFDASRITDPGVKGGDSLLLSMRGGAHSSNLARDMVRSEKDFYKKYGTKPTYRRFFTQNAQQQYLDKIHETDKIQGKRRNNLTDAEKAAGISDAIVKKISKAMSDLQKARPDIALEDLAKYFEAVQQYNEKAGRSILSTMLSGTNMSLGKYFGLENYFDVGFGSNDYRKNKEKTDKDYAIKNDPLVIETVKNIFKAMKSQATSEQTMTAEELRQRRAAVNLTISKTNKRGIAPEDDPRDRPKYGKGVSMAERMIKDLISPDELSNAVATAFNPLKNVLEDAKKRS